MSYRLFTRNDCQACSEVKTFFKNRKIEHELVDLDNENDIPEALHVKIVPALFKENKLMAYGTDIIAYILSVQNISRSA